MSREMDRTRRDWIRRWTHERLGDAIPRENEPLDWNIQMLDALDAKDERIAELQTENERLQRVIKNRDNRIRNKTNQLKEVHNRRIAPYTDQIREQGQYIEGLKVAREQDGERIGELEAENQRLHSLYYGEREAHNSRGGA